MSLTADLSAPLDDEQIALLRTVYGVFASTGAWPIWQYIDLTLDQQFDLDAGQVFSSLPRVGFDTLIWPHRAGLSWPHR